MEIRKITTEDLKDILKKDGHKGMFRPIITDQEGNIITIEDLKEMEQNLMNKKPFNFRDSLNLQHIRKAIEEFNKINEEFDNLNNSISKDTSNSSMEDLAKKATVNETVRRFKNEFKENNEERDREELVNMTGLIGIENIMKELLDGDIVVSKSGNLKLTKTANGIEMLVNPTVTNILIDKELFELPTRTYPLDSFEVKSMVKRNSDIRFTFTVTINHDADEYWARMLDGTVERTLPELLSYLYMSTDNAKIFEYVRNIIMVKESK